MMPARLGERSDRNVAAFVVADDHTGPGAARGLAEAVEGATLALAKFAAAVGRVLAASMARIPDGPGIPGTAAAAKLPSG
jgi:hypothetical protein